MHYQTQRVRFSGLGRAEHPALWLRGYANRQARRKLASFTSSRKLVIAMKHVHKQRIAYVACDFLQALYAND